MLKLNLMFQRSLWMAVHAVCDRPVQAVASTSRAN